MTMATIRVLENRDADRAGDVNFLAFYDVALRHGQTPVVTTPADARSYVRHLLSFDPLGGLVAELDGGIVGMAWLHQRRPVATIGPVAVDPRVQGRGIGRLLIDLYLRSGRALIAERGPALAGYAFGIGLGPVAYLGSASADDADVLLELLATLALELRGEHTALRTLIPANDRRLVEGLLGVGFRVF